MALFNSKTKEFVIPEGFTVTAHSGAFGTPDNSLEFIRKAVAENCAVLETDVTFRPDGRAVMIHSGSPSQNEGVPLEEAFEIIAGHPSIRLNLDLKSTVNLPAVDALLKEYGLFDRAFFTGVGEDWAPVVKANSGLPYYINVDTSLRERRDPQLAKKVAHSIASAGGIGINSHYNDVSSVIANAVRERGLKVSVWTANDVRAMKICLALGADNITTRHPDVLKKLIESVQ
ncbi:MAG: glycerophosphodiester phosphodiesterase [Clostridia bacterium]|nr:glycerophosphodiester phosphodiesterase [Clostridia bacterium]